jgi:hypothetical protein
MTEYLIGQRLVAILGLRIPENSSGLSRSLYDFALIAGI